MTASEFITYSAIQERLEAQGFEISGEDTGGGCFVGYAVKEGGQRVTLGPFSWEEGLGLVALPGDFCIGPDEMDPETGDSTDVELINVEAGSTLDDIVTIAVTEYEKLNA